MIGVPHKSCGGIDTEADRVDTQVVDVGVVDGGIEVLAHERRPFNVLEKW